MAHVLVIGGSGGVAQGLVQHYLSQGWQVSVFSRQPALNEQPQLRWYQYQTEALLTADSAAIAASLQDIFASQPPSLVFCCIGALQHGSASVNSALCAEKNIRQLSAAGLTEALQHNTVLPMLWLSQLSPWLRHSPQIRLCWLSAKVGSISDNKAGGWYSYRASKAALNMLIKTFAVELRRSLPQACVVSLHPGTTDTALSAPFQRNLPPGQLQHPAQTAARLAEVAAGLIPAQSGALVNWDGTLLPF